MGRSNAVDRALAVGHVLVAVAVVGLLIDWWKVGTQPEAELAGLAALAALALVPPTAAFLLMSLADARRALRRSASAPKWSYVLGSVETALGVVFTMGLIRSIANYRSYRGNGPDTLAQVWGAVWRLDPPSAGFLLIGLATLGRAGWRSRVALIRRRAAHDGP